MPNDKKRLSRSDSDNTNGQEIKKDKKLKPDTAEQQNSESSSSSSDKSFNEESSEYSDSELNEEVSDSDDNSDGLSEKEIPVTFVAVDPIEEDFHGVKALLKQLFLNAEINYNELIKMLIEELPSTIIKQDEDDDGSQEKTEAEKNNKTDVEKKDKTEKCEKDENDEEIEDTVFGLVSLIPFNSDFKDRACVKQIKNLLLSNLPKTNEIHKKLSIEDVCSRCVLIINERFINLPSDLCVPCYKQLVSELKDESKSFKYDFDWVIMYSKLLKFEKEIIFSNGEDEIFDEQAEASHEYSVQKQIEAKMDDPDDDERLLEPFRKIMLFSRDKWQSIIETLKNSIEK